MGGCLPAAAPLYLRQLTNFAMVIRMPKNPLHSHVCHLLTTAKGGSRPWYYQIRNVYKQYGLPHPLTLLESPLSKEQFKKLLRSKIVDYWEQKLRAEFSGPPSLEYFRPELMSLKHPQPSIWWTAGFTPYEITKSGIQYRMLSGQYRTRLQKPSYIFYWSIQHIQRQGQQLSKRGKVFKKVLLRCPACPWYT